MRPTLLDRDELREAGGLLRLGLGRELEVQAPTLEDALIAEEELR